MLKIEYLFIIYFILSTSLLLIIQKRYGKINNIGYLILTSRTEKEHKDMRKGCIIYFIGIVIFTLAFLAASLYVIIGGDIVTD